MKPLKALLLFLCAAQVAHAQRLTGVVRDSSSHAPLSGVVVTVLNASSASIGNALADENGRYSVALGPQAASVRVVRIGYQPLTLPLARNVSTLDIAMEKVPTLLTTVGINNERLCSGDKDRRAALSLWDQVHAALLASVVAREAQPANAMLMRYDRFIDTTSRVLRQTAELATLSTKTTFVSGAPPATLAEKGYVEVTNEGQLFTAPDADVLLDDTFAATHCFSYIQNDPAHPGQVGLAFEPAPGREKLLDVRGALWVSAATPALNSIEYHYAGGPPVWERTNSGGVIHFQTESNGVIFVDRWYVRLPSFSDADSRRTAARSIRVGGRTLIVQPDINFHPTQFHEDGGIVLSATWPNELHFDAGLVPLHGTVTSPDGRSPLSGALVIVPATGDTLTTDEHGHFELSPAIPGHYVTYVADTSFGTFMPPRVITKEFDLVGAADRDTLVAVPSRLDALSRLCGAPPAPSTSVILGRVKDVATSTSVPQDARIQAAWLRTGGAEQETQTVSFDDGGHFSICGVPRGQSVRLSVVRHDAEFADTSIVVSRDSIVSPMDWRLSLATLATAVPPRRAGLQGKVTRLGSGTPVANADVWIATLNRHVSTDSSGSYRLADLTPGVALLQVREVGYQVKRDTITLTPGVFRTYDMALTASVSQLDTVHVVASALKYTSPGLRGFETRRVQNVAGYFISDSALRANDNLMLSSVILSRVAGLGLVPGRQGALYMVSTRKPCAGSALTGCSSPNCYVTVYMDGALLYTSNMGAPPLDAHDLPVSELSGVEFYAGTGVGPPEYNATGSGCGTLLLWTRER